MSAASSREAALAEQPRGHVRVGAALAPRPEHHAAVAKRREEHLARDARACSGARPGMSPGQYRISSGWVMRSSISLVPQSSALRRPSSASAPHSGAGSSVSSGAEVRDVEDRALALLLGLPDRLDRHPDPDVLGRDLAELVEEPAARAVDRDHGRELGLLQRLHVVADVADRERLHGPGRLDLDPPVGVAEAPLAEHPRRHEDALARRGTRGRGSVPPRARRGTARSRRRRPTRTARRPRRRRRPSPSGTPPRDSERPAVVYGGVWTTGSSVAASLTAVGSRVAVVGGPPSVPMTTTVPTCIRSPHACATPRSGVPGTCRAPACPLSCQ